MKSTMERGNRDYSKRPSASYFISSGGRGFTLVELLIILFVILTLTTMAFYGYAKVIDVARKKVCKANLKALLLAVEFYAEDNDGLPATLGRLGPEHIRRAYARLEKEDYWTVKLARLVVDFGLVEEAHAGFLRYQVLKDYTASRSIFEDPSDPNGGISYGINATLMGRRWDQIGGDVVIIADSDSFVFSPGGQVAKRHKDGPGADSFALAIKKNQIIVRIGAGCLWSSAASIVGKGCVEGF